MKKLILSIMISIDGFIENPEKDISWHNWSAEMDDYMNLFFNSVDTILLGRKTYENMAAYWPKVSSEEQKIRNSMNNLPKIVLSSSITSSHWNNTRFIAKNAVNKIIKLKEKQGKNIVAFGGAGLSSFLADNNLIDEYRFIVNPVILGKGTAVFNNLQTIKPLKFKESLHFECGNVLFIYNTKQ